MLRSTFEKCHSLINSKIQNVTDIFFPELYFQNFLLESFSGAMITFEVDICHELHFYLYHTLAFAFLTSSSGHIERKEAGFIVSYFGDLLICKEGPDVIKSFDIGCRIGAGRSPDRVLVNKFKCMHTVDIARQTQVLAGPACITTIAFLQGGKKDIAYKG